MDLAMAPARYRRRLEVGLVVVTAVGYGLTASPYIVGGDNPEFVTLFAKGGVAHPSGYPLYVLWLQLAHALWPGSSPAAYGASVATAVLGVVCVGVLNRACLAWGATVGASAFAALFYAFAPMPWRLFTSAEVFALNALLAALILWCSAPNPPVATARQAPLLGLLAGLALSNHLSAVFMAPLGVTAAWLAIGNSPSRIRTFVVSLLAFGCGLLPYGYLAWAATLPGHAWRATNTWAGFLGHITRLDYGTFKLAAAGEPKPWMHLRFFLEDTMTSTFGAAMFTAPAWFRVTRNPTSERPLWLALGFTWLLAGPLFVTRFNLDGSGVSRFVESRFYLLPATIMTILVAKAADDIRAWVSTRFGPSALVQAGLALVPVASRASLTAPEIALDYSNFSEHHLMNILAATPPNAILFTTSDTVGFGMPYVQRVHGLRPDVIPIVHGLLSLRWYREKLLQNLDVDRREWLQARTTTDLLKLLLLRGRPVVIAEPSTVFDEALRQLPSYPLGPLVVVLPPDASPPAPEAVEEANRALYESVFSLPDTRPPPRTWARIAHGVYAVPWTTLATTFEARGNASAAERNRARARPFQ